MIIAYLFSMIVKKMCLVCKLDEQIEKIDKKSFLR